VCKRFDEPRKVSTQYVHWTDRQTDRQTDRGTEIPFQYRARRVSVLAHGKYLIAQTLVQRDYKPIHHTISIISFTAKHYAVK